MSEFYTKTGNPANQARGLSALMRAEFALIEAAFSKLPDYSTAALKIWRVNAGGTGVEAVSAGALLSSDVAFTGDITPTQLTATADNYNPTGLSTSSVLRLSSDASRNITGLDGGADGRLLLVHNIGSFNIVLKDADTGSDADNRFALDADVTLRPDWCVLLQYDVTSFRWRMVGLQASAFMQTVLSAADAAAARTALGLGALAVLNTVTTAQIDNAAVTAAKLDAAVVAALLPPGAGVDFFGTSAPTGFLLCDGSNVSRTTYAALFAAIGTTHGSGDGTTTFTLPDVRRRVSVGSGGTGTGTLGNAVGNTGGAETHTLTTTELAVHSHNIPAYTSPSGGSPYVTGSGGLDFYSATSSEGGGGAHNNMQPSIVVLKIIKT